MLEELRYTGSAQAGHKNSPSMKTNLHLGESRQTPSCTSCPSKEAYELGQ